MARKAIVSMPIPKTDNVKSYKIFVITSAGQPTMAFWDKKEAERVMLLTMKNMPKSVSVKPHLFECELY